MRRFVLLGDPVEASLSPLFHNAALQAAGVEGEYRARKVDERGLADAVEEIRRGELTGINVTIPHKRAAMALCDRLTEMAKRAGAVNWVALREGKLLGDNTDVEGLARVLPAKIESAAVIGSGGAARAAVVALETLGVRGIVVSAHRPFAEARAAAQNADLVLSAVPASAWAEVAPESMKPGAFLQDLAYAKDGATPAVLWARERGIACADGRRMLLEQGALSFERWLGVPFPRQAAETALGLR